MHVNNWTEPQLLDEIQRVTSSILPQSEEWKEYVFILCLAVGQKRSAKSKYCKNVEERDEFAVVIAEEIYMLVVEKDLDIQALGAYIDKLMPQFCGIWLRLKGWEKPQPHNAELYYDPEHARRISPSLTTELVDKVCTGDMVKASWDALHKFIRYHRWENSVASRNAHLSIVLSIRQDKFVSFHLNDKDSRVCRLLFNRYRLLLHDILTAVSKDVLSDSDYLQSAIASIFECNGIGEDCL